MLSICPCCKWPIPKDKGNERAGVLLTPLQVRIFDLVRRSNGSGLLADDILQVIYAQADDYPSLHTIYVTVMFMNKRFKAAGKEVRIKGGHDGYRVTGAV